MCIIFLEFSIPIGIWDIKELGYKDLGYKNINHTLIYIMDVEVQRTHKNVQGLIGYLLAFLV